MEAPGITRHRRPFLAPLWVTLLAALVLAAIAWGFYHDANTTVVLLVRAADKEPGTIEDPPMSQEGEARAQRLALLFGDGIPSPVAIYESDERRAQQTMAPLAERLHLAPVVFRADEARATAGRILHEHGGGTVVVVASAVALPAMLRELADVELPAAAEPANVLYVVSVPSIGRAQLTRLRF